MDEVSGRNAAIPGALLAATEDEPLMIEGYLAAAELMPAELDDAQDAVEGAFGRTVGLRFANVPEASPALFVNLMLVTFDEAEAAEQALYALDDLTLPSLLPPPTDSCRQQATIAAISGVDAFDAFNESWRAFLPGGPIDSVRLGFVLDDRLAIVEVAGGANLNAAHEAAVLIAEAQRKCLDAGDLCDEILPVGDIQDLALIEVEPIETIEDADPDRLATFDAVWNEINDRYLYRTGRQYALYPAAAAFEAALPWSDHRPTEDTATSDLDLAEGVRMTRPVRRRVRLQTTLVTTLVLALTLGSAHLSSLAALSTAVSAQDATPDSAENGSRLDLAAIVLDAADLPDGVRLIAEQYVPVADLIAVVGEDLEAPGLIGFYESRYGFLDNQMTIRSYAEEYEDEAGAAAGFAVLDDAPVPGVEGDDEEVTTIDYDAGGGFRVQGIDATVRLGRVVVGAAMENFGGTDAPDPDLVNELIAVVAERAESVTAGDGAAGRDLTLPAALLTASDAEPVVIEGYLAPAEIVPEALDDARDAVEGAFGRTVGLRFANATETPPVLFVNLMLVTFAEAEAAEQALYALDDLTLPSLLPPPTDSFRQQATTAAIPRVDAFNESWRAFLPGGPIDSVRLGFVLDDRLAIVEVAGGANLNAAHEAAVLIAEAQRDCLDAGDVCEDILPVGDIQNLALIEAEPIETIDDADPDRQATFDAVWNEINDRYLYRTGRQNTLFPNYHELDWGAVRAEYEQEALDAETDEEFYLTVAAMVDELGDQHTGFLSPEDTEINSAFFSGELMYAGIGVDLSGADLILQVFPDSPAEAAGLQRRDRIEAVGGDPLPVDDLAALRDVVEEINRLLAPSQLPDDAGDPLTLTVRSPGEEPRDVVVERDTGEAPIVPSGMRLPQDENIGYLVVPDFVTPDLQERVVDILDEMLAEGPLDGLILDLRANPGGSVGLLQTFLGLFVEGEAGAFYHRDGTLPEPVRVDAQELKAELEDVPLVVLTDDRMYSASEVGTAILQDRGRATVVGVTSPGDVEVLQQSFYPDGSSLYIVLGVFVLPGSLVEGVGNIPDVPVLLDWTDYTFADDPQILAGIETIQAGEAPSGADS